MMKTNWGQLIAAILGGVALGIAVASLASAKDPSSDSDPSEPSKWSIVQVGTLYNITPPTGDTRGSFMWVININGVAECVPFYVGPMNPVIGEAYELQKCLDNGNRQQFRLVPHLDWKDRGWGKLLGVTWYENDTEFEVRFEILPKGQARGPIDVKRPKHIQMLYGHNLEHADYKIGRIYTLQHAFWNGRELQRLVF